MNELNYDTEESEDLKPGKSQEKPSEDEETEDEEEEHAVESETYVS